MMRVVSTSRNTASVEDIMLRETTTSRLVFRPLLVNNELDGKASIKGCFVFQRKGRSQQWEDHKDLDFSRLKAQEWIKLDLHSEELLKLFRELNALYELHDKEGIHRGEFAYVRATKGLAHLLATPDRQFDSLLEDESDQGQQLLIKLLNWFLSKPDQEGILHSIEGLDAEQLSRLSEMAGLRVLREILEIWNDNQDNSDEEFWQKCLGENGVILSQVFPYPVVIVEDKAYVGNKLITNKGGKIVDFLLKNEVTHNAVLVEIKTPMTALLSRKEYRDNVYSISTEISGAITQVLGYRQSLIANYPLLRDEENEELSFEAFEPAMIIIVGNSARELTNKAKRRSFELFRSQLRHVQLITYDELFAKISALIHLLEGKDSELAKYGLPEAGGFILEEDNIPF